MGKISSLALRPLSLNHSPRRHFSSPLSSASVTTPCAKCWARAEVLEKFSPSWCLGVRGRGCRRQVIPSSVLSAGSKWGNERFYRRGARTGLSRSRSQDSPRAVAFEMTARFGRRGRLYGGLSAPPRGVAALGSPPNQAYLDTRGFSWMTLSSQRLKASSSFFILQGRPAPFLYGGVSATPRQDSQGGSLRRVPPMYTAGSCYDNAMGLA